jgi:hypothetical protein
MSVVVTAVSLLVRPLIITIINLSLYGSIISRSRSNRGFNLGSCLLLCLAVVVGVIEDYYLAVTRRPEDIAIKITKKLSGDFLITRSISNERGRVKALRSSRRRCPTRTPVSRGSVMVLPTGTPVVVETRMTLVVKFRRRRTKDFPLLRESVHA